MKLFQKLLRKITPLLLALQGKINPEIIDILLNHRAAVNVQNKQGETPLSIAVKNGFNNIQTIPGIILRLIQCGAENLGTNYLPTGLRAYIEQVRNFFLSSGYKPITPTKPEPDPNRSTYQFIQTKLKLTFTPNKHTSIYEIYGISQSANKETIRDKYRKMAKVLHPDKHPKQKDLAGQAFGIVTELHKRAFPD